MPSKMQKKCGNRNDVVTQINSQCHIFTNKIVRFLLNLLPVASLAKNLVQQKVFNKYLILILSYRGLR
jgi:hypothetical protein